MNRIFYYLWANARDSSIEKSLWYICKFYVNHCFRGENHYYFMNIMSIMSISDKNNISDYSLNPFNKRWKYKIRPLRTRKHQWLRQSLQKFPIQKHRWRSLFSIIWTLFGKIFSLWFPSGHAVSIDIGLI